MGWAVQAFVRAKPFGKAITSLYEFDRQPSAADLLNRALQKGSLRKGEYVVYDSAQQLAPSTILLPEMCLIICPKG